MPETRSAQGPSLTRFFLYELPRRERNPLATLLEWRNKYGEIVTLPMRRPPTLQLANPEDIRHVLVTNGQNYRKTGWLVYGKEFLGDGILTSQEPLHTQERNIMKPAFHRQVIHMHADIIVRSAQELAATWTDGSVVDISQEMARLALANVGEALLGTDLTADTDELIDCFTDCQKYMMGWMTFLPSWVVTPLRYRYLKAVGRIDRIVYRIIAEHRAHPRQDLISMLLCSAAEHGGMPSDRLIRDEIVTMMWAGHETNYNALEWAWYLLSQNPSAESRLLKELNTVLDGEPPCGQHIEQLKYTGMVFAETLRLYPPAWILGRWTMDDDVLPSGFTVPRRTQVLIIPYVVHRDARFFSDPDRFEPERFNPEKKNGRPPFAYFPFGGGQRVCIGEHFGKMQGVLALATIAQQCKLTLVPGQNVEPSPLLTLRPRQNILMRVEKR